MSLIVPFYAAQHYLWQWYVWITDGMSWAIRFDWKCSWKIVGIMFKDGIWCWIDWRMNYVLFSCSHLVQLFPVIVTAIRFKYYLFAFDGKFFQKLRFCSNRNQCLRNNFDHSNYKFFFFCCLTYPLQPKSLYKKHKEKTGKKLNE